MFFSWFDSTVSGARSSHPIKKETDIPNTSCLDQKSRFELDNWVLSLWFSSPIPGSAQPWWTADQATSKVSVPWSTNGNDSDCIRHQFVSPVRHFQLSFLLDPASYRHCVITRPLVLDNTLRYSDDHKCTANIADVHSVMKNLVKKFTSPGNHDASCSLGLLILRIASGGMMLVAHGWGKLLAFSEKSGGFLDPLGIGSETSMAMAIFAEVVCALAIQKVKINRIVINLFMLLIA